MKDTKTLNHGILRSGVSYVQSEYTFVPEEKVGFCNSMIQVAAVSLVDPLDTRQFDKLIKTVSMEKRRRIYRFRMHEDAQRTLLGDILARYLVCKQHNVKNCELVFGTNAYGKPYLLNDTRIQFNISHSGKWVVCSLHHLPVGVDIEQIKPVDISIAERFFSKSEVQSLMNKCISERETYFMSCGH